MHWSTRGARDYAGGTQVPMTFMSLAKPEAKSRLKTQQTTRIKHECQREYSCDPFLLRFAGPVGICCPPESRVSDLPGLRLFYRAAHGAATV